MYKSRCTHDRTLCHSLVLHSRRADYQAEMHSHKPLLFAGDVEAEPRVTGMFLPTATQMYHHLATFSGLPEISVFLRVPSLHAHPRSEPQIGTNDKNV